MIGGGARNKEENRATRPGAGMPSTCGVAKVKGDTVEGRGCSGRVVVVKVEGRVKDVGSKGDGEMVARYLR